MEQATNNYTPGRYSAFDKSHFSLSKQSPREAISNIPYCSSQIRPEFSVFMYINWPVSLNLSNITHF
jgi:hypothetical protein